MRHIYISIDSLIHAFILSFMHSFFHSFISVWFLGPCFTECEVCTPPVDLAVSCVGLLQWRNGETPTAVCLLPVCLLSKRVKFVLLETGPPSLG